MHATTKANTIPWKFEVAEWNGLASVLAVAFVKIGHILDDLDHTALLLYIKDIPMSIPDNQQPKEFKFTCRVWFKEAIRQLNRAGVFVKCDDVEALEKELSQKATAAEYMGLQRPFIASSKNAGRWS